jgi:branched-chain amino acid transport system ATP-binding protein
LPTAGSIEFLGRSIAGHSANRVARYGIGRTHQIPRPFRRLSMLENVALAAYYGQEQRPSREKAFVQAREALELVGLPTDPVARVEGLGAAALKKLELARALATQPKLLLADESLGGLDETEMEQAAEMLARIRSQRGITIVWVEHIMGVLMRIVDRCVVLDHGEVIAAGRPEQIAHDRKVVEVYLGTDAQEVQATVAARGA